MQFARKLLTRIRIVINLNASGFDVLIVLNGFTEAWIWKQLSQQNGRFQWKWLQDTVTMGILDHETQNDACLYFENRRAEINNVLIIFFQSFWLEIPIIFFWPIVYCLFFYFILFYLGYRFSLHIIGIIYISSECLCVVVCPKHSLSCQSGVDSTENARLLSWIYNFHNWNEHLWAWWFSIVFAELTAYFGNKYKNNPYFLSRNYWNRSILYT